MAYENKPNTGALFKNENKQKDSQPDYTGPFAGPDGTEMQIAAWLKKSAQGKNYMSISVSPKFAGQRQEPAPRDEIPLDDEIPF